MRVQTCLEVFIENEEKSVDKKEKVSEKNEQDVTVDMASETVNFSVVTI